jgi:limonene-1,2-epoxide hydrolase
MTQEIAEKFIAALGELESGENVENIVSLFADDCEVGNTTLTETMHGRDGAHHFWTNYRKSFGEVRSEFRNTIYSDRTAALEWTSKGTADNGHPIDYEGVSILEIDGDKITRFFAYFNPGKLGMQMTEGAHG